MNRALLALGALAVVPLNCHATYFDTGNKLFEFCTEGDRIKCLATVSGGWDMMTALGYECQDKGVQRGQIADVVTKYMRENPHERHLPASFLIVLAGEKFFGCKRK
jgi:hypothetical protein